MFGLFDSPKEKIRKKVPKAGQEEMFGVETFVLTKTGSLPEKDQEYILGFVLSIWALKSSYYGKFFLSDWNTKFIENYANNLEDFLSEEGKEKAKDIVLELMDAGRIPE